MKKKGLIISTAVMVVVLIAALTTGTFAWFTVQNSTKVEDITMSVEAGSDVLIGVATDNKFASSNVSGAQFMSDSVTWSNDSSNWTGGTAGALGYSLNTNLSSLVFSKAVFTGTTSKIDDTFGTTKAFVAASGNGASVTAGSITEAVENQGAESASGDYIHIVLGVQIAKDNIAKVDCKITVTPTEARKTLGMNAALSYLYKAGKASEVTSGALADASADTAIKPFYDQSKTFNSNNENAEKTELVAGTEGSVALGTGDIYLIDLYIFINGKDADCINAALGSGCSIKIEFTATQVTGD